MTTDIEPPQYPKGDFRRLLCVLAAMDRPKGAKLLEIAAVTGIDKKSVTLLISQATAQAGVSIIKDEYSYRIEDWGPVLKRSGAKLALTGAINAPIMKVL